MKIGLVRRGYSATGGAERYLLRFAAGLESRGHSCVLFCDRLWPREAWGDREQRVLGAGRGPARFADALESEDPARHCEWLFSLERVWSCDCYRAGDGVHAAWLERRAASESPWRSVARRLNPKHRQILELERALYSPAASTHVIANSAFVAAEMRRCYGTPPERVTVIPNGFDPPARDPEQRERTRREGRAALGLGENTVAFLFAGSGWERKGLSHGIAAVERLAREGSEARLLVAGKDKRRPPSRGLAATRFLGPLDAAALGELYEAADVFLLPTWYDPFSNACLEAASHGLPVITTAANGVTELRPPLAGSVVNSPDSPELFAACASWLDAERRAAARGPARAAAAPWTVARNIDATLACFDRLAAARSAQR